MSQLNKTMRRLIGSVTALTLAACVAPTEPEATDVAGEAIVNGTAVNLGANTFVRFPGRSCSGTFLSNQWVLTANHCLPEVGDAVQMDNQSRSVQRVVRNPYTRFGTDIALVQLSAPMAVNGSTSGFSRPLRSTLASKGSHLRCYGYGQSNGVGISAQLRFEEVYLAGINGDVYVLNPNAYGQYAGAGDAGGGCLDDTGAAVGVLMSHPGNPTQAGQTFLTASTSFRDWANTVMGGGCIVHADCTAGYCNEIAHVCVASACEDGLKDNGEAGIDCGGSCAKECTLTCPDKERDCGGYCWPKTKPCN